MRPFHFKHWLTLLALAVGAALRLWFVHSFKHVDGDSLIYGDIAINWLTYGIYGLSAKNAAGLWSISPTLIRLPGYPAFLALCFKIFGVGNYRAVLYLQTAVDLASCLLIAAFVRRVCSERAGRIALWLAVLCPFTANYAATPLTETLSVFCVALGFYEFVRLLEHPNWLRILILAFAWSYGALLRPDGALLAVTLFVALIVYGCKTGRMRWPLPTALVCALLSILPFVPWTIRNWRSFHVFQPLAPRSAADPGEFVPSGFEKWSKTWIADFASTYEISWNVPGGDLDISKLPSRAFDSPAEYRETRRLFDQYNLDDRITPELDAEFARLAAARVRAHPLRFYLGLPLLRLADMWLRPRVAMMNIELRWWQYSHHRAETRFAVAYGALNLAYLAAALAGFFFWPEFRWVMLGYLILRSLLLLTIASPEARYTLEFFPIVIAFAARAVDHFSYGRV